MTKEVAIIIPVHNALQTIMPLMASILAQTQRHLCKIILIIDDQNDYTFVKEFFNILDIVFLHTKQPHSGPGVARNIGLQYTIKMNIPYIVFADADDLFYSTLSIELLYAMITQQNLDFVYSPFYRKKVEELEIYEDLDVWLFGKIYRTQIIAEHNITFPSAFYGEDQGFNFHYINTISSLERLPYITYLWQENSTSLTATNPAEHGYLLYPKLCEVYTIIFNKLFNDQTVKLSQLKIAIPRKIIVLYIEYNRYYTIADPRYNLKEIHEKLHSMYIKALSKHWLDITQEDWMKEWGKYGGLGNTMPQIGFMNFLNIITKGDIYHE